MASGVPAIALDMAARIDPSTEIHFPSRQGRGAQNDAVDGTSSIRTEHPVDVRRSPLAGTERDGRTAQTFPVRALGRGSPQPTPPPARGCGIGEAGVRGDLPRVPSGARSRTDNGLGCELRAHPRHHHDRFDADERRNLSEREAPCPCAVVTAS